MVVITGASSGLGESLAHVFYLAGCKVVLAARRRDELERVRRDLMETHSVGNLPLYYTTQLISNLLLLKDNSHSSASGHTSRPGRPERYP